MEKKTLHINQQNFPIQTFGKYCIGHDGYCPQLHIHSWETRVCSIFDASGGCRPYENIDMKNAGIPSCHQKCLEAIDGV